MKNVFKILVLGHQLRFCQNGLVGAGLNDAPLVEGQGAEGASAEAATVAHKAEFHLFNSRHTPQLFITGMIGAAIGKGIDSVHFLLCQRLLRGILHHESLAIGLGKPFGGKGVAVAVLDAEAFRIGAFVGFELLEIRQQDGGEAFVYLLGAVHRAVDIGDVLYIHAGI